MMTPPTPRRREEPSVDQAIRMRELEISGIRIERSSLHYYRTLYAGCGNDLVSGTGREDLISAPAPAPAVRTE